MARTYRINEIFYSLQGEGFWTGTPAVFVRFSGCNLRCPFCDTDHRAATSMTAEAIVEACVEARRVVPSADVSTPGLGQGEGPVGDKSFTRSEDDKPACRIPDEGRTQETMGGAGANEESGVPLMALPSGRALEQASIHLPIVVLTGGEPGLQVDEQLVEALHGAGFRVHIETNGTQLLPKGIDWVTLSPKVGVPGETAVVLESADEIKVLFAAGDDPSRWAPFPAAWHFLQPCDIAGDPAATQRNTAACIAYILAHPSWRLSLQTHKLLSIR